jgi:hypothetical protein
VQDRTPTPISLEEQEYRCQLRAQQLRAKLLFHCYAVDEDDEADDDPYCDYYAEDDASCGGRAG